MTPGVPLNASKLTRSLAWLANLIVGIGLCGTPAIGQVDGAEATGRAVVGQRVELERVIDGSAAGKKKWIRWVTGENRTSSLFGRPYGVAWEGDDLLVTDPGLGRVVRIDRRGRVKMSPEGAFATPIDIATCNPWNLVTDSASGEVVFIDKNLKPVGKLAEGLTRPTGIACTESSVFVVETGRHRILVYQAGPTTGRGLKPSFELTATFGERGTEPGEFNFPTVIALGVGSLWVGDTLNFRIQRLDAIRGEPLREFGQLGDAPGEMPRIKGITVDPSGFLWVSDAYLNQVSLYSPDGTFLMYLGEASAADDGFSFPAGIAAHPDGRVAVVDSMNRRIQIYRLVPSPSPEKGS